MIVVPCNFLIANIYTFEGYAGINSIMYFLLIAFSLPSVLFTMQVSGICVRLKLPTDTLQPN